MGSELTRGGRGDVNAATAAETVNVVHEQHYSRVGQREAASHTVAQLEKIVMLISVILVELKKQYSCS